MLRLPTQDELRKVERRYEKVHAEYLEAKRAVDNLQFWQMEIRRLEARLEEAVARLPQEVDVDELLVTIPNVAKKNSLVATSFELGSERPKQGYAEVPMSIKMEGPFRGFYGFTWEVANQPRIMVVQNFKAKRLAQRGKQTGQTARGGKAEPALQIEAEVVTYRALPQANARTQQRGGRR